MDSLGHVGQGRCRSCRRQWYRPGGIAASCRRPAAFLRIRRIVVNRAMISCAAGSADLLEPVATGSVRGSAVTG